MANPYLSSSDLYRLDEQFKRIMWVRIPKRPNDIVDFYVCKSSTDTWAGTSCWQYITLLYQYEIFCRNSYGRFLKMTHEGWMHTDEVSELPDVIRMALLLETDNGCL